MAPSEPHMTFHFKLIPFITWQNMKIRCLLIFFSPCIPSDTKFDYLVDILCNGFYESRSWQNGIWTMLYVEMWSSWKGLFWGWKWEKLLLPERGKTQIIIANVCSMVTPIQIMTPSLLVVFHFLFYLYLFVFVVVNFSSFQLYNAKWEKKFTQ